MIFIPFDRFQQRSSRAFELVTPLAEDLNRKLKQIYKGEEPSLSTYLQPIFRILDPKGKTILNLGCGCIYSPDSIMNPSRQFEPWLSRALHEYGANSIGVDRGDLSMEKFKGYSRELADLDSLKILPNASVDLACAYMLFDSPTAENALKARNYYRGQYFPICAEKPISLFQIIALQLERVLKPGACFLFDSCCVNESDYRNPFDRRKKKELIAEVKKLEDVDRYTPRKKA
jgi:hypothetical protein